MYSKLNNTINQISEMKISEERKEILKPLINFIQGKVASQSEIRLNFICTHNSRRSHLGQIWAQTLAYHFGIKNIACYSGGTEETAMFPKIVETLQNQGFEIEKLVESNNSVYAIKFDESELPIIGFSKKYDANFNPKSGFAAIMTCSSADEGCPFVFGSELRIAVRYDDPKAYDGTDLMNEKYSERSFEIASELYYVFSQIKK